MSRLALVSGVLWMVCTPILSWAAGRLPGVRVLIIGGWLFFAACLALGVYYSIRVLITGEWRHK